MKYLLYLQDGFIKKVPFSKTEFTLGRDRKCDIVINESFMSRTHARLELTGNQLKVEDCGSTNGVYVEHSRLEKAVIELDESFRIGHMDFFFKQGDPSEFTVSEQTRQVIRRITDMKTSTEDTRSSLNLFDKTLIHTLEWGFRISNTRDILTKARDPLSVTLGQGSIFLLEPGESKEMKTVAFLDLDERKTPSLKGIGKWSSTLWEQEIVGQKIRSGLRFFSFPVDCNGSPRALLYFIRTGQALPPQTIDFLRDFAHELSVLYLFNEKNRVSPKTNDPNYPIITVNEEMIRILEQCRKIARGNISLLVAGETGTGKELIARFVHSHSDRHHEHYIGINCSAIPENLLEDELFGHEPGAFTDARNRRVGKLELASGGTLVLDEIGDMPLSLQAKLLRVLQEEELYRLGGNDPIKVNLRVVALTNQDIHELIQSGRFRQDLYYRIAHFIVSIPPLRDRKEDILPLLTHFLNIFEEKTGTHIQGVSDKTIEILQRYSWPGNVRQLENTARCLTGIADTGDLITPDLLGPEFCPASCNEMNGSCQSASNEEKTRLLALMNENHWNKTRVAAEMGISRTALYNKLKRLGIK